jgi:hypothetical protein
MFANDWKIRLVKRFIREFGSSVKLRINITAKVLEESYKGPASMRNVKNIIAVASGKGRSRQEHNYCKFGHWIGANGL